MVGGIGGGGINDAAEKRYHDMDMINGMCRGRKYKTND